MKKYIYIFAFCLIMTAVSCKKTAPPPPPEISSFSFGGPGAQWKYLRTVQPSGSTTTQTDTLTLVVESDYIQFALIGNNCGIYINGVKEDSGLILGNAISIEYDPTSYHPLFPAFLIELPIYNNEAWGVVGDSTHVSYYGDYQGIDSVYHNVYQVSLIDVDTMYISPSMGLVYERYRGLYDGVHGGTLTLTLLNAYQ